MKKYGFCLILLFVLMGMLAVGRLWEERDEIAAVKENLTETSGGAQEETETREDAAVSGMVKNAETEMQEKETDADGTGYLLVLEDSRLAIYRLPDEFLFEEIDLSETGSLSDSEKEKLASGMIFLSEEEMYHYLESLTS